MKVKISKLTVIEQQAEAFTIEGDFPESSRGKKLNIIACLPEIINAKYL